MIFLAGFLVAGNIICMKYDVINFNYEGSWFNIVLAMVVVGYAIPSIIKNGCPMNKKDVCKECRGWCCYRFCISLISTASQEPDWEAEHAREDAIHKDLDFMEKNFRKVGCRSIDNCDKMSFHFTCLKYDKVRGICTEYKKRRPYACISLNVNGVKKG